MPDPGQSAPASRPRPTLRRVADAAGVSLSTASLVFSGKGPVATETAARVRAAALDLGYAGPNPLASSLRTGRSGTVALVVEDRLLYAFRDPFSVGVLDGLAQELDATGSALLLVPARSGADPGIPRPLRASPVDAAVYALCGPRADDSIGGLLARGVPVVAAGAPDVDGVTQLDVDEEGACARLAEQVRAYGHTRVALVTMPLDARGGGGPVTRERAADAAYPISGRRALGAWRVYPDAPAHEAAHNDVASGALVAHELLARPAGERPTAVLAQSDVLAAGVVRAAEALGLSVPGDVSVTGFDGVALPWLDHTLTTVVQDAEAKGRRLGELVRARLEGAPSTREVYPTTLRVGSTVAAPPPA